MHNRVDGGGRGLGVCAAADPAGHVPVRSGDDVESSGRRRRLGAGEAATACRRHAQGDPAPPLTAVLLATAGHLDAGSSRRCPPGAPSCADTARGRHTWGQDRRSSSPSSAPCGCSSSSPSTRGVPAPRRSPAPPASHWPPRTTCCAPAPTRAGCSGWTTARTCWATASTSSGSRGRPRGGGAPRGRGSRGGGGRKQGAAARGVAHARRALEWLRDEIVGAVYLAGYVDGEVAVAEIVDSARAPRIDLWVGIHDAAHATALGKCILGQLSATDREDYLARHPLHGLTPRTVVDRRRLTVPSPGDLAVDDGEYAVGVSCLAAPVATLQGAGAVAVVVAPRAVGRPEVRQAIWTGAARVSRALALGSSVA